MPRGDPRIMFIFAMLSWLVLLSIASAINAALS